MTVDDFIEHTKTRDKPESTWFPPLRALWYAENGQWEKAHEVTQEVDIPAGAWVHANLHREEGDLPNARYWYSRAGKPESAASVEAERREIAEHLLRDHSAGT